MVSKISGKRKYYAVLYHQNKRLRLDGFDDTGAGLRLAQETMDQARVDVGVQTATPALYFPAQLSQYRSRWRTNTIFTNKIRPHWNL